MEFGLLRKSELILQSLSHRLGGLSGVVPRGVMDQQAAEDEVRTGTWLRTGVATLIYVEEMHAA